MEKGSVVFVGAGPGDPDLISVKGLKAIQLAEVLLYDALVSPELLEHASSAKQIYVGKRKGKKEFSQEEINQLLVFYARKNKKVVRLKGGDPNVFGRGHEEALFVLRHGITTHTINGISSAIAAPAAAGIPLTMRGISESFWVITGTVSDGTMSRDIELAAQSSATLVILMGIAKLKDIALLIEKHRSAVEPAAIVFGATWPEQKVVVGTASTIVSQLADVNTGGLPGVIIIGQVVNERNAFLNLIESNVIVLNNKS